MCIKHYKTIVILNFTYHIDHVMDLVCLNQRKLTVLSTNFPKILLEKCLWLQKNAQYKIHQTVKYKRIILLCRMLKMFKRKLEFC